MRAPVTLRMLLRAITSSRLPADAGVGVAAASWGWAGGNDDALAAAEVGDGEPSLAAWITRSTSARVIRPAMPVPTISDAFRPLSVISRRTTGESNRPSPGLSLATDIGGGGGGGGAVCSNAGAGAGSAGGAGAGSAAGVVWVADSPPVSTRTNTVPTSTVSPSATANSVIVPATGDGTSESTLSVDTSKRTSSTAIVSPTFLNHLVMVPSVTVSPSCGITTSVILGSLFAVNGTADSTLWDCGKLWVFLR